MGTVPAVRPLPIAVAIPSFHPGGTERQMIELVRRLDPRRWAVHVLTESGGLCAFTCAPGTSQVSGGCKDRTFSFSPTRLRTNPGDRPPVAGLVKRA